MGWTPLIPEKEVKRSDEPLRTVVNRMAESGFTRFPVLDPRGDGTIVGMVSLNDLLHARTRNLETSVPAKECCVFACRLDARRKNARSH